jgi:hypothetical protein
MKEIIEMLEEIKEIACHADEEVWEDIQTIDRIATSALDKLKAQEEEERYVVQVKIPELDDNGSCNAKCPIIDNCDWNDWINCDWFPVNFHCPHCQK